MMNLVRCLGFATGPPLVYGQQNVMNNDHLILARILGDSSQRLSFVTGQLSKSRLPPYMADLVVATEFDASEPNATEPASGEEFILTLYERLRPYGGVACLAVEPDRDVDIRKWLRDANHREAEVERSGEWLLISRTGALPGAVDYNKDWRALDARVRAPLGILWFDDAIGHFKRSPQPNNHWRSCHRK